MCLGVYVCLSIYLSVCMRVVDTCLCECVSVCTYSYVRVCLSICLHVCMRAVYVLTCMRIWTFLSFTSICYVESEINRIKMRFEKHSREESSKYTVHLTLEDHLPSHAHRPRQHYRIRSMMRHHKHVQRRRKSLCSQLKVLLGRHVCWPAGVSLARGLSISRPNCSKSQGALRLTDRLGRMQ